MSEATGSDAQGGLDGLLESTEYQVSDAPVDGVDGDNNEGATDSHEGLSPESANLTEQPPTGQTPEEQTTPKVEEPVAGTQNNDGPSVNPEIEAMRARTEALERQNQQYQQQEAMRREQAFQARLADMTPEDRTIALQQRRIQMQQQELQKAQQLSQTQESNNQMAAKRVIAAMTLSENELPPFAIDSLMAAGSLDEMRSIAERIKTDFTSRYVPVQQQASAPAQNQQQQQQGGQQQQQQVDPYAGGGTFGSGTQVEMPEVGSGDIDALLNATPYESKSGF